MASALKVAYCVWNIWYEKCDDDDGHLEKIYAKHRPKNKGNMRSFIWRGNGQYVPLSIAKNGGDYCSAKYRESLSAMPTNQSEAGNLSSSGQHSYELLICCRWDRRTARDEGIVRCVIVNDYCLYTGWPVSPSSFLSASAAGWIFFMLSEAKKEPNSTKWWAKEKEKKKSHPL